MYIICAYVGLGIRNLVRMHGMNSVQKSDQMCTSSVLQTTP